LIRYQQDLDGVTPERLTGLSAGWPDPPPAEAHLRIISGSKEVVLAIDSDAGNRLGCSGGWATAPWSIRCPTTD